MGMLFLILINTQVIKITFRSHPNKILGRHFEDFIPIDNSMDREHLNYCTVSVLRRRNKADFYFCGLKMCSNLKTCEDEKAFFDLVPVGEYFMIRFNRNNCLAYEGFKIIRKRCNRNNSNQHFMFKELDLGHHTKMDEDDNEYSYREFSKQVYKDY